MGVISRDLIIHSPFPLQKSALERWAWSLGGSGTSSCPPPPPSTRSVRVRQMQGKKKQNWGEGDGTWRNCSGTPVTHDHSFASENRSAGHPPTICAFLCFFPIKIVLFAFGQFSAIVLTVFVPIFHLTLIRRSSPLMQLIIVNGEGENGTIGGF